MNPDHPAASLAQRIAIEGPVSVADFMAAANAHYYATRDPLGLDFITAPEISQMFGELVGVWLADLWQRASPAGPIHYVELGPGRGTLAQDALRVLAGAKLNPRVELVETSPTLRSAQAAGLAGARWHEEVATLPTHGPLLIVANEFFDALPVRQFVRTVAGWRERMVAGVEGAFTTVTGDDDVADEVPPRLRNSSPDSLFETSPSSRDIIGALAVRIAAQGGAMLIVDYGHPRTAIGETLQAVRGHAFAEVFANPGEHDLTAHVDFEALATTARLQGVTVCGPRAQGEWLTALGISMRAAALARADPTRQAEVFAARQRLVGASHMGRLFKVVALSAPCWPQPEGF